MERGFQQNALSYLLFLRLIPVFPFFIVNIVPAFLGVSWRTFMLGTLIGIVPGTFVYASIGSGLGALLQAGQKPDLGSVLRPEILLPMLALALLALAPVIYKKLKGGSD